MAGHVSRTVSLVMQDVVDCGWLYINQASHFTGVTNLNRLLLTALELASGLAYLHSLGIIHADLIGGSELLTAEHPRGFLVKA